MVIIHSRVEVTNSGVKPQERTILEDPMLGKEYERYRSRVQYKLLPYIW